MKKLFIIIPLLLAGALLLHQVVLSDSPSFFHRFTRGTSSSQVAVGANDFAFRIGAEFVPFFGDENFIMSPFSVWMPLVALANATDESHLSELLEVLGVSGIDLDDVNATVQQMMSVLISEDDTDPTLLIANAIFVSDDWRLQSNFVDIFDFYFNGTAESLDFSSDEAVEIINQWASDNTKGLIDDVIQGISPEIISVLVNAIYFSDNWVTEFNPDRTRLDMFTTPSGSVETYFMIQEWDSDEGVPFFENDELQAITLPYVSGGGMTIILPRNGDANELFNRLDKDFFNMIKNQSVEMGGTLKLPSFSFENELDDLAGVLIKMGLPLFDTSGPLTGLAYTTLPVFISDAVHVALIEVNEEGATAAAFTAFHLIETSVGPPTFFMNCNSPFIFIIHKELYGSIPQILFTGVVNDPSA